MDRKTEKENKLIIIPKTEKYIEYMLQIIFKLPRIEKFSIGTEYKTSMYKMLEQIMLLNKMKNLNKIKIKNINTEKINQNETGNLEYYEYLEKITQILNKIDAYLNTQRIYLRIMKKYKWIDEKKFKIAMELIYEIGKILGGLIKYYAKNNKKSVL